MNNELEKAMEVSVKLIEKEPEKPEIIVMHGRVLVDLGRYAEGLVYLNKAIALDENKTWISAWAWGYIGHANFMTGNNSKSEEALKNCQELNATKTVNQYANRRMFSFGFDPYFTNWQIVETANIRFHIQTPTEIQNVQEYTSLRENAFTNISKILGSKVPKKIDFFVWNNSEEPQSKFNITLGFANPDFACVYSQRQQTPGHEITHVITHYLGKQVKKVGLINEGTAVYFDQTKRDRLAMAKGAVQKSNVSRVVIKDIWEQWETCDRNISYPLAGAFIAELVDRFGIEGLKKILTDQTYENAQKVFGKELDDLIAGFEKKLGVKQTCLDTTRNDFITTCIKQNFRKGAISLTPIVLIDGEDIDLASVQELNLLQDQIENISMLTGEAANNVFKERGKNGVLLVTTKASAEKFRKENEKKTLLFLDGKEVLGEEISKINRAEIDTVITVYKKEDISKYTDKACDIIIMYKTKRKK